MSDAFAENFASLISILNKHFNGFDYHILMKVEEIVQHPWDSLLNIISNLYYRKEG
jgi:hypothetical protein